MNARSLRIHAGAGVRHAAVAVLAGGFLLGAIVLASPAAAQGDCPFATCVDPNAPIVDQIPPFVPVLFDSDGDGLYDWSEVNGYGTDPGLWDSDGDGFSDGDEIHYGSQPWDPSSTPPSPPEPGPGPPDEGEAAGGGGIDPPELLCNGGEELTDAFGRPTGLCAPRVEPAER